MYLIFLLLLLLVFSSSCCFCSFNSSGEKKCHLVFRWNRKSERASELITEPRSSTTGWADHYFSSSWLAWASHHRRWQNQQATSSIFSSSSSSSISWKSALFCFSHCFILLTNFPPAPPRISSTSQLVSERASERARTEPANRDDTWMNLKRAGSSCKSPNVFVFGSWHLRLPSRMFLIYPEEMKLAMFPVSSSTGRAGNKSFLLLFLNDLPNMKQQQQPRRGFVFAAAASS